MSKIIQFFKKHPIIRTLFLIFVTSILLVFITLWGLNIYTQHDKAVVIPDVTGIPEAEAIHILKSKGFRCEVYDSIFVDNGIPGNIAEQVPEENSKVKSGRKVFLKIIAYSPRTFICPQVEGSPSRQAKATLESAGFRNITIKEIPAEFNDLVMGVECGGKPVQPGEAILYNETLTLLVGKVEDATFDEASLTEDSDVENTDDSTNEDWFN